MSRYNRPPTLPGVPEARSYSDAWRISWWILRGSIYGMGHGSCYGRIGSSLLALSQGVLFIPVTFTMWGLMHRPWVRYYMSPERNAVLGIVAKRGAWHIVDHVAAQPGHRQGKALRDRLIAPLTIAADSAGIEVCTVAANRTLADQYMAQVPGMVDVGRGIPRGRKLRRPPVEPTTLAQ